jgi:4-amino-4-deoxy-L-arabinose transferase-like glycosyltransferase
MQLIEAPQGIQTTPGKTQNEDRRNMAILLGACLVLFFLALGSWGFIDPGDGYFSEASREMMERGDYIVPHLNYQIYFSKPILIYWLIISAYKVFGVSEFAARFWSAALATGAVLTCYWTVRSIWTKRAGLFAGLVLATSPLVITFARMSLIDMGFAALLGIALCATAMTLFTESRRWWPAVYAALGLAVLDKGPAAAVLYGLCMLAFVFACRPSMFQLKDMLKRLRIIPGLALFTLISVPWYVAVGVATKGLWPQVFFFFENFGRFAGHTNHRNPSWWFYIPVVAYGFFPWSFLLPAALLAPVQDAWRRWQSGATIPRWPRESAELLFACWSLAVIFFFSLSMTKLQTYILPAWPAMACLVGVFMDRFVILAETGKRTRYMVVCGKILAVLGVVACLAATAGAVVSASPAIVTNVHARWAPRLAAEIAGTEVWMRMGVIAVVATAAIGLLGACVEFHKNTVLVGFRHLLVASVIAGTIGGITFYHIGYKYKNADAHRVAAAIIDKPGPVALFRDFKPSLVYHLQRPVDTFFSVDQLRTRDKSPDAPPVQYIIAGPKGAADLVAAYPTQLEIVAHSGDWYAFSSKELVALRLPTLEKSFTQHIDLSGGEFSWGTLPFAGGTKP